MSKFYVDSGNLQCVIAAEDPKSAACGAIRQCLDSESDTYLGKIVRVNEIGFLDDHAEDCFLDTIEILNSLNIGYETPV